MALKLIGESGVEADTNADKALYVEVRSPAIGTSGGVYSLSLNTGLITATLAANSDLFSFRWRHPSMLCLLRYVAVSGIVTAAVTTGVQFDLALYFARNFTVAASGGTSFGIFSPDNNKLRRDFGASLVADARASSTAALTTGTRTLDTNPMARVSGWTGTTLGTRIYRDRGNQPLVDRTWYGMYPFIFAANEGFVIQNPTAGPATGTFALTAFIEWQEVASY